MRQVRQSHAAGDKLFVDYAGYGVPVVSSGIILKAAASPRWSIHQDI
jgi:hypothetical protein